MPLEARLPATTVWQLLTQSAVRYPQRVALSFLPDGVGLEPVQQWTYAELLADCQRAAHAWEALGLQHGQGVGVLLPNRPEVYMATYGAQVAHFACALSPLMGGPALGEPLGHRHGHRRPSPTRCCMHAAWLGRTPFLFLTHATREAR